MLGNIIGGFIVILVGEQSAHYESNFLMLNPEYRLTSLRRQDRSVNVYSHARENANGFLINSLMEGDSFRTCNIK
jgi:hypothetical protein